MLNPRIIIFDKNCARWKVRFYNTETHQFEEQDIEPTEFFTYVEQIDTLQPSDVWQIYSQPGTVYLMWEKITVPV